MQVNLRHQLAFRRVRRARHVEIAVVLVDALRIPTFRRIQRVLRRLAGRDFLVSEAESHCDCFLTVDRLVRLKASAQLERSARRERGEVWRREEEARLTRTLSLSVMSLSPPASLSFVLAFGNGTSSSGPQSPRSGSATPHLTAAGGNDHRRIALTPAATSLWGLAWPSAWSRLVGSLRLRP